MGVQVILTTSPVNMPGCCPEGSYGNPPFPGYSWNDKGVVEEVGDMKMYRTGSSSKCIIWCYDIYGFEGGRTRQLCDQLADSGYMVMRLSAYTDFKAGVSLHPATTCIAQDLLNEELYEVLDEVGCPQLVLTAGEDHSNEKPGGLAAKVWGVMSFGQSCVLRTYPDMVHGWTVRGDMRDPAVSNAATAAFTALKGFLDTHVK